MGTGASKRCVGASRAKAKAVANVGQGQHVTEKEADAAGVIGCPAWERRLENITGVKKTETTIPLDCELAVLTNSAWPSVSHHSLAYKFRRCIAIVELAAETRDGMNLCTAQWGWFTHESYMVRLGEFSLAEHVIGQNRLSISQIVDQVRNCALVEQQAEYDATRNNCQRLVVQLVMQNEASAESPSTVQLDKLPATVKKFVYAAAIAGVATSVAAIPAYFIGTAVAGHVATTVATHHITHHSVDPLEPLRSRFYSDGITHHSVDPLEPLGGIGFTVMVVTVASAGAVAGPVAAATTAGVLIAVGVGTFYLLMNHCSESTLKSWIPEGSTCASIIDWVGDVTIRKLTRAEVGLVEKETQVFHQRCLQSDD